MKLILPSALAALITIAAAGPASACACCSNRAQRVDTIQAIDDRIRAQLDMLRFRSEATLALGERYEDVLEGIPDPTVAFTIAVNQTESRITFSLRDAKGRAGTLALINPQTISIFEVDQHDTPETGLGPVLYKEWRITASVAGDGIFLNNAGPNRQITLILHGRGRSCTDVNDFGNWSLHVRGQGAAPYAFYGELRSAAQQ